MVNRDAADASIADAGFEPAFGFGDGAEEYKSMPSTREFVRDTGLDNLLILGKGIVSLRWVGESDSILTPFSVLSFTLSSGSITPSRSRML